MIPKAFIETVLQETDLVALIETYVVLKDRGQNRIGLCPFDGGKKPLFSVSPDKKIWKCFKCGRGGNAIKFLMEIEKATYPEAIKIMAERLNLEVPYED